MRLVTGATKKAAATVAGCARAAAAPSVLGMPLARIQKSRFSPAASGPFVQAIQPSEARISAGIPQPSHFQIGEIGGTVSIA